MVCVRRGPGGVAENTTWICSSTDTCRGGFCRLLTQPSFPTPQLKPLPESLTHSITRLNTNKVVEKGRRPRLGRRTRTAGTCSWTNWGAPGRRTSCAGEAHKLLAETGVRKVRLYDARHACLSWMAKRRARHGGLRVGRTQRPVVHEAGLRAPRPAVVEGGFGEAGRTARPALINSACEKW